MSKLGSHDRFGHLKHKLWPKERSGVKLAIWLPTTKIWESTRFPFLQVECDMVLESSWRGLQLWFWFHCNRRSTHKVMRAQSRRSPNVGNFGTLIWDSHLEVPGQKTIWMWASQRGVKYTIWGKVVASPESGPWWVLWIWGRAWFVLASKVLHLCTYHLVLVYAGTCN
jgi:hypothetical protein